MARYLKQDSELGYIEDTAEIQYQKFNNLRHSIIGFMMGDFDQQGNYVISPEIKRELIAMPKSIVESLDNIEICQSELKLNKHLSFMVTFEGDRATLSLLEKVNYEANFRLNSGSYSNINEYLLDEVRTSGTINRNAIYQRWNIKEFGGNQVDIFNCDEAVLEKYFGIVNRFKYLLVANKELLNKEEQIEEIESAYANKMLNILKAYPALNKAVTAHIKETIEEKKKFVCVDEPNFAKTINEIIDSAIQNNIDLLPEEKKEEFKAERRNLIVETNIKKQEVVDISEKTQSLEKEDVKFNKEHDQEIENETKVVKLDTNGAENRETVTSAAEKFAQANSNVEKRLDSEALEEIIGGNQVVKTEDKVSAPVVTSGDSSDSSDSSGQGEKVQSERDKLIKDIVAISPGANLYSNQVLSEAGAVEKRTGEEEVTKQDGNEVVVNASGGEASGSGGKGEKDDKRVVIPVMGENNVVESSNVDSSVDREVSSDGEGGEGKIVDGSNNTGHVDDGDSYSGSHVGSLVGAMAGGSNRNVTGIVGGVNGDNYEKGRTDDARVGGDGAQVTDNNADVVDGDGAQVTDNSADVVTGDNADVDNDDAEIKIDENAI